MTLKHLLELTQEAYDRWPDATIRRNAVGNFVVVVDGMWVAAIDPTEDDLVVFDE